MARMKWNIDQGCTFRTYVGQSTRHPDTGELLPLNLVGYTAVLRIRDDRRGTVREWTLDLDSTDENFMVVLSATETAEYAPKVRHFYTVDVTAPDGEVTRWLSGPLFVEPVVDMRP